MKSYISRKLPLATRKMERNAPLDSIPKSCQIPAGRGSVRSPPGGADASHHRYPIELELLCQQVDRIVIVVIEVNHLMPLGIDRGGDSEQCAGRTAIELERVTDETLRKHWRDLECQIGGLSVGDVDVRIGDNEIAVRQQRRAQGGDELVTVGNHSRGCGRRSTECQIG